MKYDINNASSIGDLHQDEIDSRDLVKLLDRLEGTETLAPEETALLFALRELRDKCESSGWKDGIQFINEDNWEDYCQEFAESVGYCGDNGGQENPLMDYMDWERWAYDMKGDYSEIHIGDRSYYWREA